MTRRRRPCTTSWELPQPPALFPVLRLLPYRGRCWSYRRLERRRCRRALFIILSDGEARALGLCRSSLPASRDAADDQDRRDWKTRRRRDRSCRRRAVRDTRERKRRQRRRWSEQQRAGQTKDEAGGFATSLRTAVLREELSALADRALAVLEVDALALSCAGTITRGAPCQSKRSTERTAPGWPC